MSTITQLIKKKKKPKNKKASKIHKTALRGCPHKKAACALVTIRTPKKPNSATRKVVKAFLRKVKVNVWCHIPGERHPLQRFSTVLVRGGRVKDLPGVKYRLVRNKYDLPGVLQRRSSRSRYGVKNARTRKARQLTNLARQAKRRLPAS